MFGSCSPENRGVLSATRVRAVASLAFTALLLALLRSAPLRAQAGAVPAGERQRDTRPELELQVGHLGWAECVAFSPDGKILASGGADRKIILWDVASGAVQRVLTGHTGDVRSLAWSPDGAVLVSGSPDGTVRFWNTQTGAVQRMLNSSAWAVALSPDGKRLASGGDGTVKLWDTQTGGEQRELLGHQGLVRSLAFSPDGQRLAVGSGDDAQHGSGQVKLWDLSTGAAQWSVTLREQSHGLCSVAFSPDGRTIATGSGFEFTSGEIHFWDTQTGALQRSFAGHTGVVNSIAFSPDGQTLVSGSADLTVKSWDVRTGATLRTLADPIHPAGCVLAAALARDGQMLAAAYDGGEVKLWDTRTGVLRRTLGWQNNVFSVAISPDGKLIAGGAARGALLRVWDAQTGALKWIPSRQAGDARSAAFSRDGKILACASEYGTVKLWDVKTRAELRTFEGGSGWNWVVLSPDGKMLARPGPNSEPTFWDVKTGEPLRVLPGHNANPGVAFSPDGKTVATCSSPEQGKLEYDKPAEIQLWDVRSWQLLRTLKGHLGPVTGFTFSPDSRILVTGNPLGIWLWDAETGELLRRLQPGHWSGLTFSPDGKILTGSGTIRLWHVATGLLLRTLTAPTSLLTNSVAFSSDGRRLISGGSDHTVRIWEVSTGRLLATLITLPPRRTGYAGMPGMDTGADEVSSDWVAITPEGYYDASPGAARFISWKVGADLFPVEAYEHTFHRPDLLRRSLAGEVLAETPQVQRFAAGQAIPPQVVFLQPSEGHVIRGNTLPVELAITDDQPDLRVQLTVNGRPAALRPLLGSVKPIVVGSKPIAVGAKPIVIGSKPIIVGGKPVPFAHHYLARFRAVVPLPMGERQFTLRAVATDRDALIGWADLNLSRAGAVPMPGDLYVLAVGISHYHNPQYNLKYAAADAAAFAQLWPPMAGHLYRRVYLTQLTDAQATAARVRAALTQQLQRATNRDSVALFLSGHGIEAEAGQFYFATSDLDASSREEVAATALPWTLFQESLAQVKAKRVFLFLDACHSGSALGEQQASNEQLAEAMVRRGGVLVFASSRAGEYSYEDSRLRHGAFTAALLEGIGQGKADLPIGGKRDGRITAEELLAYLRTRVPQLTQNRQTPSCPLLYDFGEEFLLARAR